MSTEYVSQHEVEAHEAAMQRVVENERKEQETIRDKKKLAIKAADEKMRKAIKAAQRANDKAIKAAKKEEEDEIKAAEMLAEEERKRSEKKLAAMQRDFEHLPLLRQVYHEAPDDVFELMVSKCSKINGWGWGGLNAFRLANKRLKEVVESCTTMLTNQQELDGPESLPIPIIQRCGRIEEITLQPHCSRNLRSLEGCPDGLKKLFIGNATHLSDLSPVASCTMMESLRIMDSSISDISVVSSMPLLEELSCQKDAGRPSIKDLTSLSSCPRLKEVWLAGNVELKDLSPLSACTALETLSISRCPLITGLTPLSTLSNLQELYCPVIDPQISLLPLASCPGLKRLYCNHNAVDLEELRRRRPVVNIHYSSIPYYSPLKVLLTPLEPLGCRIGPGIGAPRL